MQGKFVDFIKRNNLIHADDSILIGVSGGIDSMVMLHLFHKTGFKVAVAHCNFTLRGNESDGDEELVAQTARNIGVMYHSTRFETQKFAKENKLSIQVAARNLRYDWFNDICVNFGYTKIAIAHNLDDIAETVLLNLTRGTGLRGLTGIKPINGNVIRPLLFATRKDIEQYAIEHGIIYRSDSSNISTKYKRNFIRHKVIPELEKLNPSAKESIAQTAVHIQEYLKAFEDHHKELRARILVIKDGLNHYALNELISHPASKLFLLEEFTPYGFSPLQIEDIQNSFKNQPGKVFYSNDFILTRDREFLILSRKNQTEFSQLELDSECKTIDKPIRLDIQKTLRDNNFKISKEKRVATFDHDKLKFPLLLRKWHEGDRFKPFGMEGYKKISDFLVDEKIPLIKKNNIYVLTSGEDIIWVVGLRIHHDYRITPETKTIYQVRTIPVI